MSSKERHGIPFQITQLNRILWKYSRAQDSCYLLIQRSPHHWPKEPKQMIQLCIESEDLWAGMFRVDRSQYRYPSAHFSQTVPQHACSLFFPSIPLSLPPTRLSLMELAVSHSGVNRKDPLEYQCKLSSECRLQSSILLP